VSEERRLEGGDRLLGRGQDEKPRSSVGGNARLAPGDPELRGGLSVQPAHLPAEHLGKLFGALLGPRLEIDRRGLHETVRDGERGRRQALLLGKERRDGLTETRAGDGKACRTGAERSRRKVPGGDGRPADRADASRLPGKGDVDETVLRQDERVGRPVEAPVLLQGAAGAGDEAVSRQRSPC
jgi:hypothetical protein